MLPGWHPTTTAALRVNARSHSGTRRLKDRDLAAAPLRICPTSGADSERSEEPLQHGRAHAARMQQAEEVNGQCRHFLSRVQAVTNRHGVEVSGVRPREQPSDEAFSGRTSNSANLAGVTGTPSSETPRIPPGCRPRQVPTPPGTPQSACPAPARSRWHRSTESPTRRGNLPRVHVSDDSNGKTGSREQPAHLTQARSDVPVR